jgi:chemotaxis protein CheD
MKIYDGRQENASASGPDTSPERVKVGIAEYEVTTDGALLTTSGLGSCLGVALYDARAEAAGLVHVMLPAAEEGAASNPAKYADTGVELLVDEMVAVGASRESIRAKIAGGSDMLNFSENGSGIGVRNIEQVEETLAELGVEIVGTDVGGDHGRSLRLDSTSGDLIVKSANEEVIVL